MTHLTEAIGLSFDLTRGVLKIFEAVSEVAQSRKLLSRTELVIESVLICLERQRVTGLLYIVYLLLALITI